MIRPFLIALLLLGLSVPASIAQADPTDQIAQALQQSDAGSLAAYFNETVDLGLPDNDNSYSASQGEMIMKDFFRKYPPESFSIIQKGTTDPDSRFAIGTYKTGSKEFRVYIQLRKEKSDYRIHKIKFEEK